MNETKTLRYDEYCVLEYKYNDDDYWRKESEHMSLDAAIVARDVLNKQFKETRAFRIIKVTEEEIG